MRTLIQTPTGSLADSLEFYSKLKFEVLSAKNPVIVSDGKAVIQINPDRYARAGIKLFRPSWEEPVTKLEQLAAVRRTDEGYLLTDGSGTWIYLVETRDQPELPVSKASNSEIGNYVGIGIETPEIKKSKEIWTLLGFEQDNSQWPSFTNDDQVTVTLYKPNTCPHLFFNPSLTYFNGSDNPRIIEYIRKHIPITEEITHFNSDEEVDNIIIRDPGGLGFFIFND